MKKSPYKMSIGRRKTSIVRVRMKPGKGIFLCNGKPYKDYFPRKSLCNEVIKPLEVVGKLGFYDVIANLCGGGLSGQAGALRLALARGLLLHHPDMRLPLKQGGFLSRDSRSVQRKLYGHKKARKSFQFSKR